MSLTLSEKHELFGGKIAWRELARMPIPDEAVSTEPARARALRWAMAGCPLALPASVHFIGDRTIGVIARQVLARFPMPVLHHVVSNCIVLGVGRETMGWQAPFGVLPSPSEARHLLCVSGQGIDDDVLAGVIAHEVSHAWLEPIFSPDAKCLPPDSKNNAHAMMIAFAWQWNMVDHAVDVLIKKRTRSEFHAAQLAHRLGFKGPAANSRYCIQHLRQSVEREIKATIGTELLSLQPVEGQAGH